MYFYGGNGNALTYLAYIHQLQGQHNVLYLDMSNVLYLDVSNVLYLDMSNVLYLDMSNVLYLYF